MKEKKNQSTTNPNVDGYSESIELTIDILEPKTSSQEFIINISIR